MTLTRVLMPLVLSALLQAPAPVKPPLAWASISIHESNPNRPIEGYSNEQPNGINFKDMGLRDIIAQGYHFSVMPFRDDEISGLPDWAVHTRYDILARVDPDDVEAFKKLSDLSMADTIAAFTSREPTGEMLMMQALLKDRFKLAVHWDSKERTVFTLTIAKGGLRMKPAADPEHGEMSFSEGHLSGKGVPISFLASLLAQPVDHIVVEKTGLAGSYDFDLHFEPRDAPSTQQGNYPDIFTAIQEQLGLKLQSTHAPVPVLIVDHIERPSPN